MRNWWKMAKRFYNRTNNKRHQSHPLILNGRSTASSQVKAEAPNNYFKEAHKLKGNIDQHLPQTGIPEENYQALTSLGNQ